MQPGSLLGYLLVFLGGVFTSIEPCNVAMIPLIMGVVGGSRNLERRRAFWISLVFTLGLAVTFVLLGVLAALLGGILGGGTPLWYYIAAAVCLVIGLQLLGVLQLTPPAWLNALQGKVSARGIRGAFVLGLVSGLVASQCATPVLAVILTYVMAQKASLLYGAALLFIYSLGRGVPIVLAGTFTGFLKNLRGLGKWAGVFEKACGVLIIGVGIFFLIIA